MKVHTTELHDLNQAVAWIEPPSKKFCAWTGRLADNSGLAFIKEVEPFEI